MRPLSYALQEALVSLRRSGRSAAMSVGTIAVAFLTLGGFLLISTNLRSVVEEWASAAEMSVYLRNDADDAIRQALVDELSKHPAVAATEFVSREQALERFKQDFPELGEIVASGENPFPAAIEVRLRTDPASTGAADAMAAQLADRPGVTDVRYDPRWLSRLLGVATGVRLIGLAVAAVLVLGAAFTVAAVIRLSLEARQHELDIMQLVGAPFTFIRGPFVAEGTLLGGIGAILSLLFLWGLFVTLRTRLIDAIAGFAVVSDLRFLTPQEAVWLVASGFAVGALAGIITSRGALTPRH
jgi:cell division transport system permease protein